jgi:hypothetical protein
VTAEPLLGRHSVEASARLIRHYRYAEERMMRVLGGWIALTPELPAKLLLGRHVWDCAQHADLWGRRLPELREPAQRSEPPGEGFVRFMDLLERPEEPWQSPERLAGVYRVLKPHLVSVYRRHLEVANPVYEPPTRRILERCLDEERRHVAAGAVVLTRLTGEAAVRARTAAWQQRLAAALAEAGGATGDGSVPIVDGETPLPVPPDPAPPGSAFDPSVLPDDLTAAVDAHRGAVVGRNWSGAERTVAGPARSALRDLYANLPGPLVASEVVALARVGQYRMVRLAFVAAGSRAVVQLQWRPVEGAWQVVAGQLVRVEPRDPA